MTKVLFVCSPGGHFIQAKRILPALSDCSVTVVSTYEKSPLRDFDYFDIIDINRDELWKLPHATYQMYRLCKSENPDLVISTGALPGLLATFIGFIIGKDTIWIDSIANSKKISLSGKIATIFCTKVFTQWEHIEDRKIKYIGKVL